MPNYRVLFHRKADKFLDRLDEKTKCKLLEDIVSLENFPELNHTIDIAKIEGQKGFYRLKNRKTQNHIHRRQNHKNNHYSKSRTKRSRLRIKNGAS